MSRSVARILPTATLALSFGGQVTGALLPSAPLLIIATATGLAAEGVLHRWQRVLAAQLARTRADATFRVALRDFLLVAGLLNLHEAHQETVYLPLVFGLLFFYALHFAGHTASLLVRRTRTLPVLTRNIDTAALRLPPAPPALLARRPNRRLLLFGLPSSAGLFATAATGSPVYAAAGIALSLLLAAAGLGCLLLRLLPGRRPASGEEVLDWFEAWLAAYRPTTALYFSGGTSSAYQANMWLEPLSRMEGRPLIVLRERFMMQKIGATDIPVVCLPRVADLLRLEHSTLQVMLHPANSGKTSQVLRIPTIKHAFINHGESDKLSSCNPYAKAYDEVWVAGPAARERYALADVGVEDKDIVEVGRPQLDALHPRTAAPGRRLTVLYAPTWEGWDGNPGNTSVTEAGENIVRALLADPDVRVLYKPHPMTGSVDPRAGEADARIRALIREAGSGATRTPPAAAAELGLLTQELDRLTSRSFRAAADDMERMLLQPVPHPGRAAAVTAATRRWEAAYWASAGEAEHAIVTDARPGLYSCFDQADLLISDVSSVVCDYLASGKPYAVANTGHLPEEAFRAAFPTIAAATVLAPDGSGTAALLAQVRDPERDAMAAARGELKEHLLGPCDPPSADRMSEAIRSLRAQAGEHRARMAKRQLSAIPAPRTESTPAVVAER